MRVLNVPSLVVYCLAMLVTGLMAARIPVAVAEDIVHDAEYYILYAQNGETWELQDRELDVLLAQHRKRHGMPPNIIHLLWDDLPFGAVGIPAMQPMRGYITPNLNRMAAQGMLFTRLYSEPASTPTRSASLTGQYPIRNGGYHLGYPIAYRGMAADNVTIAEVLSNAGYATGFFGKLHLGDIESTYPHKQGFDEAFFALYDKVICRGADPEGLVGDALPARVNGDGASRLLDESFKRNGYVFYLEGREGGDTLEWCGTSRACYQAFDAEALHRAQLFVQRNAKQRKPFYAAWWPLRSSLAVDTRSVTQHRCEDSPYNLDEAVGALMATLHESGVGENTLIVAMSANGPKISKSGALGEGPFRGGEGDYLEGGVRVSAQAWWPGVIASNQVVDDMVHVSDWYTTFARLARAREFVPRDRIIDGLDQSALLLNGAGFGRRDYHFIYSGSVLAATVKQRLKIHWLTDRRNNMAYRRGFTLYDLLHDHREQKPLRRGEFEYKESFRRMRARHEQWIARYPNYNKGKGPAYTGIANARPETLDLSRGRLEFQNLPFDPLGYIDHDLPQEATAPGSGK